VFFETAPTAGIPIPPVLSFYGFGGGLYRRMQQVYKTPENAGPADLEFGKSLSGISYLPDEKVGMGVMANTQFALASSSAAFNAKVDFEMQFNNSGGLNFAQLRGSASFMNAADKLGKLSDNIAGRLKLLDESTQKQPQKAGKPKENDIPDTKNGGFLTASVLIEEVYEKEFLLYDRLQTFLIYERIGREEYNGLSAGQAYLQRKRDQFYDKGYMYIYDIAEYAYKKQDELLIKHLKAFKEKHPDYPLNYF
jgi:hypothetical protein